MNGHSANMFRFWIRLSALLVINLDLLRSGVLCTYRNVSGEVTVSRSEVSVNKRHWIEDRIEHYEEMPKACRRGRV